MTVPAPIVEKCGFYVGGAFSYVAAEGEATYTPRQGIDEIYNGEADANGISLLVGYQLNNWFAVETRFTTTVGDIDYEGTDGVNTVSGSTDLVSLENLAVFAKFMHSFGDFGVYALAGYGKTTVELDGIASWIPSGLGISHSGFQWGLGGSYQINENFSVFVDYVQMMDEDGWINLTNGIESLVVDVEVHSVNAGVTYTF